MAFAQQNYQQKLSTKQELDHTIGKFPWTIGWIGIPLYNLSVDMHQLVSTHFEPMKQSSTKHLNMKTIFPFGKKKSIQDRQKVLLYRSASFLSVLLCSIDKYQGMP